LSKELISSCENCPVGWENFKNLSDAQIRLVNGNRYEAAFKTGEIIIKQGSPASSAVFLSRGIAKIHIEGNDRKNSILEIVLPSSLILGPGVHLSARNPYSVTALTAVNTCFISLDIISQLVSQNALFAAGMINDLSAKSFTAHNRHVSLIQKKMPGRLAEALLFFADHVYRTDVFDMILTRQELGEMTNMAKESVVRILKELDSLGVIKSESSKIQILDMDKLRLISERG
jgi:CRP-like cAMP-binding protein